MESPEERSKSPKPEHPPSLPEDLPTSVLEYVEKLKKAAKESERGKGKFFTSAINEMVLG